MRPRLIMRCTVQRDVGGSDPYGGGHAWVDHLVDEPCSWSVSTGGEHVAPARSVTIAGERLKLGRDTDVRANDRITRLVDHTGRIIFDVEDGAGLVRDVEHVTARRNHLDVQLRSSS